MPSCSVGRCLRSTTVGGTSTLGGTTALGRAPTLGRSAGAGQLAPLGLGGDEAAALVRGLGLHGGRLLDRGEEALDRPAGAADLVHLLGHRRAAVGELAVAVLVHRAERLVHLDELTAGQPP